MELGDLPTLLRLHTSAGGIVHVDLQIRGLQGNLTGKGQSFVVLLSVFQRLSKTVYFLTDWTRHYLLDWEKLFQLVLFICWSAPAITPPFPSPETQSSKIEPQNPQPFECRDHKPQKSKFFLIFFFSFHWVSPPVLETISLSGFFFFWQIKIYLALEMQKRCCIKKGNFLLDVLSERSWLSICWMHGEKR